MTARRAYQAGPAPVPGVADSPLSTAGRAAANSAAEVQNRCILVVAPQPFYQDRGTPIAIRQVLEALGQLGYSVDLLTYPVGADVEIPGLRILRAPNPFGIRDVPIGLSRQKLLLDLSLDSALSRQLRRRRYTCIHAVEEAAFLAVAATRLRRIPILYDMQSSLPEQLAHRSGFGFWPVRRALDSAERWLLRRCDLVVASAGLASHVSNTVPEAVVREWRFPSSAEAETPPAEGLLLRKRLGLSPDAPLVVYSGTFEAYQGLHDLLDAIPLVRSRVPDTTFVLVGAERTGDPIGHASAAALQKSGALRIIERQPRDRMGPYLAMADVLVSPRNYGGNLPLKIFDYLAAGRPIVASDIPTHRTALAEDRAVLVDTGAKTLAEGIIGVLEDRHRALQLGHAARQYAKRHLGWDAFVDSVAELYDEVHAPAKHRLIVAA